MSIKNWSQVAEKCVHGLPDYESANSIRELTLASLKKTGRSEHYQVKVRKYPLRANGGTQTFSVLVFERVKNDRLNVSHGVVGSDSYSISAETLWPAGQGRQARVVQPTIGYAPETRLTRARRDARKKGPLT